MENEFGFHTVSEVKLKMAGPSELASFVKKFENLWQSGRNATLHMETRAGNAFVNLYLDLGHAQDHHGHRNGDTSRERRRQKRAAERQAAAQSVELRRIVVNLVKTQKEILVLYVKELLKI